MVIMQAIFFDLDGTLTESGPGIIKAVQYALNKMGCPEADPQKLRFFIGPPLLDSMLRFRPSARKRRRRRLSFTMLTIVRRESLTTGFILGSAKC
jgi:Predicted phosphatases